MSGQARSTGRKLSLGLVMLVVFAAVLVTIFLPLFGQGQNGLNYMDNLYNSISKASAYYIPQVRGEAARFDGRRVEFRLAFGHDLKVKVPPEKLAANAAKLLAAAGARAKVDGVNVIVSGGLGAMLAGALNDADAMFNNQGAKVSRRYGGIDARAMLYCWWQTLAAMQKSLNKQQMFAEAAIADRVMTKAVETAYNYYGVVPQNIADKWGIVLFSLIFYVVYTLWYGYAVMFMFEGAGFKLEAH